MKSLSRGPLQFSLRALLVYISLIGGGLYVLTNPTRLGFEVLFPATIYLFLIAIIVSQFGRPNVRAFALGFGLFGICYFALEILLGRGRDEFGFGDVHDSALLTDRLLEFAYMRFAKPPPPGSYEGFGGFQYAFHTPDGNLFWPIGHLCFAWFFAFFGGTIARLIHVDSIRIGSSCGSRIDSRDSHNNCGT